MGQLFVFLAACVFFLGCKTPERISASSRITPQIAVTIMRAENGGKIRDRQMYRGRFNEVGRFVPPSEEELHTFDEKHSHDVDFVVVITNISKKTLAFFNEDNSWGYFNLKLFFKNPTYEFVVHKKPTFFLRNFPSKMDLSPGESFRIPVALTGSIWEHADTCKSGLTQTKGYKKIHSIRALYEQYAQHPRDSDPDFIKYYNDNPHLKPEFWHGSTSSPAYPIGQVMKIEK